jgi:hypothetical protein
MATMADTSAPQIMAVEIEKLSRLISDELDAALVGLEIISPQDCRPYDMLLPIEREAIQRAAKRVYHQMVFDPSNGVLRVVTHSMKTP